MPQFSLKDAIVPEIFAPYVQNLSTKTNRFITSGITTSNFDISAQLTQPGTEIQMPFINDLEGDPQIWNDTTNIAVDSTTTGKQRAFKFWLAKAFGYTDFSETVSGAPIQETIAQRFSAYWTRTDQRILLATLKGIFANTDIATAKMFDDSANTFSAKGFLATISRLGDLQDQTFNSIAVHSATYAMMKVQQMIDTVQPANAVTPFGTYNGMNIIVDDDLPIENGVATSYIFGSGSVGYAVAAPANAPAIEVDRNARENGGQTAIINRRVLATHVMGTTIADSFATTAGTVGIEALEKGTTWDYVVDPRNIRVVAYKAKLDDAFVTATQKGSTDKNKKGATSSVK